MHLQPTQLKSLVEALALTRDDEIDCGQCFEYLAEFAELKLAGRTVSDALQIIDRHLQLCGDCAEEFELLKESLRTAEV
jgi:hypothetical protein